MKTPEEIKRGLSCCFADEHDCKNCAYAEMVKDEEFGETFYYHCGEIDKDALTYIQHLESRFAQVERERDAALDALHDVCSFCKGHALDVSGGYAPDCERCMLKNYGPENRKEEEKE